ncbi:MAG: CRISPR-associated endoribonuclease Cas6, partial [Bacteroidetes bacterium]
SYKFKIKAPKELLRLGYYAGFGEKNSMGFGCCEVVF